LADTNHLRKSGPTAGAIPFANMENGQMDDSRDVSGARNGTAKLSLHSNAGMDLFVRCMAGKRPWAFIEWMNPPRWIIDLGVAADGSGREFVAFQRGDQHGTRYTVPWRCM
jgi:hypothetical protein